MSDALHIDLKKELLKASDHSYANQEFDELILKGADYKATHLTLKDVSFKAAFILEDVNLSHGITFEKGLFQDVLVFRNIVIDKYDHLKITDSVSLTFSGCTFNARVQFLGPKTSIQRSILFKNCVFEKGLEIDSIKIERESLTFENCSVKEKLDIFRSSIKQSITFRGNTIDSYLRLGNLVGSSIVFVKDNTISSHLQIHSCKLEQGITFNDGIFKDTIDFSLVQTRGYLTIIGSKFEKEFKVGFHHGTVRPSQGIAKFYISSSIFSNGFYVSGTEDLFADRPRVEELVIDFSSMLTGNLLLQNLDVGSVTLGGYNTSAKLTLKRFHVNIMKIKGLINEGGIIFSGMRSSITEWIDINDNQIRNTAFYIDDSNLGKAQFFQTNFQSFEKIIFHNVILTEISTSLVTWFTKTQLEDGTIDQAIKGLNHAKKSNNKLNIANQRKSLLASLNSRKEIFRQLKFASNKQGDIPLSLEFQRREMEYYQQITKYQKPRQWSEYLILLTSYSNNFGQSWLRAFVGLLVFSFISYIPIGFLTSDQLDYTKGATTCADIYINLKVVFYLHLCRIS